MAHRAWLRSAGLSPDGRPPHAGADPLRVTLCLTRACDRLVSVHLVDAGHHRRPTCAGATAFAATWPSLSIEYVQVGDLHRVCLQGELDISSASAVRDRLVEVAGSTVEVDLSNLRFIDARGVGALVAGRAG